MFRTTLTAVVALALALSAGVGDAGWPPPGVPSGVMPWEVYRYKGYQEKKKPTRPAPATVVATPHKYRDKTTLHARLPESPDPNGVYMIAHLPEDARIWFEGRPTQSTGTLRRFYSDPLTPGMKYRYTVRIVWSEDGEWVGQTHEFPVVAGDVHCIDVVHVGGVDEEKEITASLGKLAPEDRKTAEAQRFCVIQDKVPLGSMGVPVKLTLNGQTVFVCCEGCEKKARADADGSAQKANVLHRLREGSAP
jgi:uncharacterized protein (TIGR03000 family)